MTPEQEQAIAIAAARKRKMASQQQQPQQSNRVQSGADAAILGALDTATFGLIDEAGAGLDWAMGQLPWGSGTSYEDALAANRGEASYAQEEHPWAYLGGQIAGGVGTGIAAAPLTASARFAGSTLGPRILAGAADGAIFGGGYGFGSGEGGFGNRAVEGATGAAIGTAAGAAFPLAAAGAGRAYEGLRYGGQARDIANQAGVNRGTLTVLDDILRSDNALGPQGQAAMRAAGPEAMLLDASQSARGMVDTAIQRGGQGSRIASDRISERVARDSQALTRALDETLGAPQGVGAAQREIADAARPGVSSAYERAYATPIDYASPDGMALEELVGRIPPRLSSTAINRANERMSYDGIQGQIMADIADNGNVTFREMPNLRQIDYIKKGLDDIVREGTDDLTGKLTPDAQFANRIAKDLRNATKKAVPAYGEALETAADPLSRQAAVRLGDSLLSMPQDQAEMMLRGMTGPERQAVGQGVRSKIENRMASVVRAVSDGDMDAREAVRGLRELSSRQARANLAEAIGKDKADKLFNELDRVTKSFEIRSDVSTNSRTYGRQAADQYVKDLTEPGVIGTAAQGQPINASQRIMQNLTGQTPQAVRGNQDQIFAELADVLTRQGGAGQNVYDGVAQMGQLNAQGAQSRQAIIDALIGSRFSYPAIALSNNNIQQR